MKRGLKYWLRWLAVLPASVLTGFLATFPLHWILYQTLTGSGIVEPYPELPERLLTPFAVCLGFVWGGARVAPEFKFETAITFFGVAMLVLGGFVFLAVFGERWMGARLSIYGYGMGPLLAIAGAVTALYLVRKESQKKTTMEEQYESQN
jgi:hypothetical protein